MNSSKGEVLTVAGTGTGIFQVFESGEFKPFGGSPLSGPTAAAQIRLITGVEDYHTMIEMAKKGDRFKCDMVMS